MSHSTPTNTSTNPVTYQINTPISPEQFIGVLNQCSLGARRPVDNRFIIKAMLDNADLLVTAWANPVSEEVGGEWVLIGVARCVTDFAYCCYLSDIAVAEDYQHQGIGKLMIEKIEQQLPPSCKIILLSAPQASDYYPKIGFNKHENAWVKGVE